MTHIPNNAATFAAVVLLIVKAPRKISQIAELLDTREETVRRYVTALLDEGLLKRERHVYTWIGAGDD